MKTRSFLGWVAMATMVLSTGCSNDEVVNDFSQDNAIEFGTYVGRGVQSRAQELTDANFTNFGVFASYTGSTDWSATSSFNFMYNQKVERTITPATGEGAQATVSDWKYSPLKYWPTTQGEKISFFAYAPYSENANCISIVGDNETTGAPQIKYTIAADKLTNAEDFVADVLYNQTKSAPANTDPDGSTRTVNFTLNHELTRLAFYAMLDKEVYIDDDEDHQTQVNIKKIEFGGTSFPLEATYNFATTNDVEATEGVAEQTNRGTWSFADDAKNKTLNLDGLLAKTTPDLGGYKEEGVQLKNDKKEVSLFSVTTDNKQEYLFLIPPAGESGLVANDEVTVTVEYDIVTIDAALKDGHSCTPTIKKIKLPVEALKQGKAYKYTLTFYLNQIVLEASVAEWGNEISNGTNVDWNDEDVTVSSN